MGYTARAGQRDAVEATAHGQREAIDATMRGAMYLSAVASTTKGTMQTVVHRRAGIV